MGKQLKEAVTLVVMALTLLGVVLFECGLVVASGALRLIGMRLQWPPVPRENR